MFGAPITQTSNASTNSDASSRRQGPTVDLLVGAVLTNSTLCLVASEQTRRVDCSRTVFSPSARSVLCFKSRPTRVSFWISQCLFVALAWCSRRAVGAYHVLPVIVHAVLALPGLWSTTGSLNADMLELLRRENEFWGLTILNVIQWGAVALAFGPDARILSCGIEVWAVQLAISIDADLTAAQARSRTEWTALGVLIAYTVIVLGHVADGNAYTDFTIGGQAISAPGLVQWTTPTLALVLLKNVFLRRRRRRLVKHNVVGTRLFGAAERSVYCCTVRARLALQKATKTDAATRRRTSVAPVQPMISSLLRSHSTLSLVDASNLLQASLGPLTEQTIHLLRASAMYVLAVLSFAGTCVGMIDAEVQESFTTPSRRPTFISVAALIGTLVFAASTARFYHRDVLASVITSFHVVFCSLQLLSGGVVLCVMYQWDRRCISVLSGAMWCVWVLLYDALTPPIRRYLRLKKLALTPLVLFTLYTLGGPLVLIYGYQCDRLHDRVLFSGVRASTFVASRVLTLWLWNARLVWDFGVRDENDLVLLSDLVELSVPRDLTLTGQAIMPIEAVISASSEASSPLVTLQSTSPTETKHGESQREPR